MYKKKLNERKKIEVNSIYAISGYCFGTKCYRGFAPLSILSKMSMADEYNSENNPEGTQRDINVRHAKEAYFFAKANERKENAIWPEIILNIRDDDGLKIKEMSAAKGPKHDELSFVKIQIDWDKIKELKQKKKIAISRVDGNHRLYFAGGDKHKNFPSLDDVLSPFCIMENVNIINEKLIFKTINFEQKKLNVSHLLRIQQQTTCDSDLWNKNKALWVTTMLNNDTGSPFFDKVYIGGKKSRGKTYSCKQKSLYDGIGQILKNFNEQITTATIFKNILLNYYNAIKEIWPDEWNNSKKYKLMTNTGLQALGIVGGKLMSQLYFQKTMQKDDFKHKLNIVKKVAPDFWEQNSTYMDGKSGRPGSEKIADDLREIIFSKINDLEIKV